MQATFPADFLWGSATSSYQIEGGARQGGRAWSIWDAHAHTPGRTHAGHTGDIACDHYNLFKEDVKLMADMGLKAYRFSISWSRVQPDGQGKVNEEGIKFYSDLIDELMKYNIVPWVTLYHWDLPLTLQTEKDGWLNPEIADFFAAYANICFSRFGNRVKHWITINEPWVVAYLGHGNGIFAPGRKSNDEPYLAAHNLLRAHAKSVKLYRMEYQQNQNGQIGITLNCDWREPLTESVPDKDAAQRSLEFFLGWFADPVYFGEYPAVMRERVGARLPHFSKEDREMLMGSSDFFGLNHYTSAYAAAVTADEKVEEKVYGNGGLFEDQHVNLTPNEKWPLTAMKWAVVPWGCRKLLKWITERYSQDEKKVPIYITENGCAYDDKIDSSTGACKDTERQFFFEGYLAACSKAIEEGVHLKGYFVWSLLDNFEWAEGYSKRFGVHFVDFETLKRTPKSSALWYRDTIKNNSFQYTGEPNNI